ncbi:hypothetical protein FPOAC1_003690 [Fusarium poae]|uniref:hypothetical protein n=1 Tax=Fusarium poae TaxID=36050 RepID=UPI001CE738CA|nr:hypothetical protein FPOAC1_003690 [Fusarium poae]KAG8677663.1 hypothetical protein FPOAC1_003690 [Fusarium poae]
MVLLRWVARSSPSPTSRSPTSQSQRRILPRPRVGIFNRRTSRTVATDTPSNPPSFTQDCTNLQIVNKRLARLEKDLECLENAVLRQALSLEDIIEERRRYIQLPLYTGNLSRHPDHLWLAKSCLCLAACLALCAEVFKYVL